MSKSSDVTRRTAIQVAIGGAAAIATGVARSERLGAEDMERVEGIGGFFFRAKNPKKLAEWYEANLGVARVPVTSDARPWRTNAGGNGFRTVQGGHVVLRRPAIPMDDQLPRPRPRQDGRQAPHPRHRDRSGLSGLPERALRQTVRSRREPDPTLATRRQRSRLRAADSNTLFGTDEPVAEFVPNTQPSSSARHVSRLSIETHFSDEPF
jgi:hypothetical protein